MPEKTCGTCGCVNGKFTLCITNMTALGCEVCLRPEETEACDKWIERTDSLEQVALDMLGELRDAEINLYGVKWLGRYSDAYADRLRALGVEVS